MRKVIFIIWIFAASVTVFSLYNLKYKVQELENELSSINQKIAVEQETLHILNAEWAHLNNPLRLSEINEKTLKLKNLHNKHIVEFSQLKEKQFDKKQNVVFIPGKYKSAELATQERSQKNKKTNYQPVLYQE